MWSLSQSKSKRREIASFCIKSLYWDLILPSSVKCGSDVPNALKYGVKSMLGLSVIVCEGIIVTLKFVEEEKKSIQKKRSVVANAKSLYPIVQI